MNSGPFASGPRGDGTICGSDGAVMLLSPLDPPKGPVLSEIAESATEVALGYVRLSPSQRRAIAALIASMAEA